MHVSGLRLVELDAAARRSAMDALVALWSRSVRTTHDFLSDLEIERIGCYVPQALAGVPVLWAAAGRRDGQVPGGEAVQDEWLGFLGMDGEWIEMLFVAPEAQGRGLGTALIEQALRSGARRVTVNEQNTAARAFYERRGFVVYERQPTDDQGGPYPVARMRLSQPR